MVMIGFKPFVDAVYHLHHFLMGLICNPKVAPYRFDAAFALVFAHIHHLTFCQVGSSSGWKQHRLQEFACQGRAEGCLWSDHLPETSGKWLETGGKRVQFSLDEANFERPQ